MSRSNRVSRLHSAEAFLASAQEATGLSDFGPDSFREGLDQLLHGLNEELALDAAQAATFSASIDRWLANRLKIEETYRRNPEIADQTVEGPVAILGLPRTGTTALTNMLSLDPQFRSLRMWEQRDPCPPPILTEELSDPRRLAAVANIEHMKREAPELMAMHLFSADGAEEDPELLALDFKHQHAVWPFFGYHAWWREADFSRTFAYHRRAALLLQWRRGPNRWVFKSPNYNFHLEDFAATYPDARFIHTHRDPAKSVPSAVSLIASLSPRNQGVSLDALGRHHAEHLRIGVAKAMASRARLGEHRFLDVYHRDLQGEAMVPTIERIYDYLGLEFTPRARETLVRWQDANHAGAHGAHRFAAEDYGLSPSKLRSDFADYIRAYDVPPG